MPLRTRCPQAPHVANVKAVSRPDAANARRTTSAVKPQSGSYLETYGSHSPVAMVTVSAAAENPNN